MKLVAIGDEINLLKAKSSGPQRTFLIPPRSEVKRFAATVLTSFKFQRCLITITQVVFKPYTLLSTLAKHKVLAASVGSESIEGESEDETSALFEAALSDTVDFLLVPDPALLTVFADHDNYMTLFSADPSVLSILSSALLSEGFTEVSDYTNDLTRIDPDS